MQSPMGIVGSPIIRSVIVKGRGISVSPIIAMGVSL